MTDITPTAMRGSKWMLWEDDANRVYAVDLKAGRKMAITAEDITKFLDAVWFERGQFE